jgi:hypothetical protein
MAKLSKSKQSDGAKLIHGMLLTLTPLLEEEDGPMLNIDDVVTTVPFSPWFTEVWSESFWAGVKALAELTGVELDEYTRASIVDPYEV